MADIPANKSAAIKSKRSVLSVEETFFSGGLRRRFFIAILFFYCTPQSPSMQTQKVSWKSP